MAIEVHSEPTWGTDPQATFVAPSYLRNETPDPDIIYGVVLRLVKYHFSDANNITKDSLKGLVFDAEPRASKIHIGTAGRINTDVVDQAPKIIVGTAPTNYTRKSINQGGSALNGIGADTDRYRGRMYAREATGGITITCEAKGYLIAYSLGVEVFNRLLRYASVIEQDLNIQVFAPKKLSGVSPRKAASGGETTNYTSIMVTWTTVPSWNLEAEAPALKRLLFKTNVT